MSYLFLYKTTHEVLYYSGSFSINLLNNQQDLNLYNELFWKYPFPNKDLDSQISKYHIDYIIVKKKYSMDLNVCSLYDFSVYRKVFNNKEYVIFQVI